MCLHDPEKIHSGLEKPLNPKGLRRLLQESFGLSRREIEMIGCGTWT